MTATIRPETVILAAEVTEAAQVREREGRKGLRSWMKNKNRGLAKVAGLIVAAAALVYGLWCLLVASTGLFFLALLVIIVMVIGYVRQRVARKEVKANA